MKFADTSWWVAWALPGDGHHQDARAMLTHVGPTERVLTTNHIVGETWTFLRRKDSHVTAINFLDRVATLESQNRLSVHRVTAEQGCGHGSGSGDGTSGATHSLTQPVSRSCGRADCARHWHSIRTSPRPDSSSCGRNENSRYNASPWNRG